MLHLKNSYNHGIVPIQDVRASRLSFMRDLNRQRLDNCAPQTLIPKPELLPIDIPGGLSIEHRGSRTSASACLYTPSPVIRELDGEPLGGFGALGLLCLRTLGGGEGVERRD